MSSIYFYKSINILMRKWINLVEQIVYRDRLDNTVIAINPSKLEWQTFKWAAGVYCKDGTVVIGDGPLLAHDVILMHASIDQSLEKYRLQLLKKGAWAELWIEDEWDENNPSKEQINNAIKKHYGQSIEEIEKEVTPALQKFMGNVPFRGVAISYNTAAPFLEDDSNYLSNIR